MRLSLIFSITALGFFLLPFFTEIKFFDMLTGVVLMIFLAVVASSMESEG